jgi:hypothetical protein
MLIAVVGLETKEGLVKADAEAITRRVEISFMVLLIFVGSSRCDEIDIL